MACWDHPRGCGEHLGIYTMSEFVRGSSPRMRGAPYVKNKKSRVYGIIPADAGSTLRNPCNPNNIIDKISIF